MQYSTKRLEAIKTSAKASEFIRHIDDLKPCKVILYVRESSKSQKRNLKDQISNAKAQLEQKSFVVDATTVEEIVAGWEDTTSKRGRFGFERAVLLAKKHGAIVVAESFDRFRRSFVYQWKKGCYQPPLTMLEMDRLMQEADGVQLATLTHPDAPPDKIRSEHVKRGQVGKGHFGGHPVTKFSSKTEVRQKLRPIAIKLRKLGLGYGSIATQLSVEYRDKLKKKLSRATVQGWFSAPRRPV
jgi:hypothetical protein